MDDPLTSILRQGLKDSAAILRDSYAKLAALEDDLLAGRITETEAAGALTDIEADADQASLEGNTIAAALVLLADPAGTA